MSEVWAQRSGCSLLGPCAEPPGHLIYLLYSRRLHPQALIALGLDAHVRINKARRLQDILSLLRRLQRYFLAEFLASGLKRFLELWCVMVDWLSAAIMYRFGEKMITT